ncbi:hypothetical protein CMUS01_07850 [Colletotrichum musicola]|uniref:Amidoligase enzyme n=1 Tax=Colletotrichum musicola TaxID=2175873 RepID=A0A8H6NE96_9PEZI|nr:hypothetical protein CMUS01_07850 [Colletotrichum musicola]
MSATQRTPTTPPRVSFGIELEFLVAYIYEGEVDPDEEIKDGLQPLVVVPRAETACSRPEPTSSSHDTNSRFSPHPQEWVKTQIRKALAKAGLPVAGATDGVVQGSVQAGHSRDRMSAFHVVNDHTIDEVSIDGYHFQGVEINSPAMYSMDISFDMIRLAVSVLTTQFRCRVNPTCGFHVHVGVGPTQRIDTRTLRNFAALLWAADPLISRLHAPWRAIARYSQSGRVNELTELGKNHGPADVLLDTAPPGHDSEGVHRAEMTTVIPARDLKRVKYFSRDRQLGEPVEPNPDLDAFRAEVDKDTVDDIAVLKGEPWTHRPCVPAAQRNRSVSPGEHDQFDYPRCNYTPPVPCPEAYGDYRASRLQSSAPSRPRPPPIQRRYPRILGTMREDMRGDREFLAPYLAHHGYGDFLATPGARQPPSRSEVMSGVRDLLGSDMTAAQVGDLMRNKHVAKHINYKFDGYSTYQIRRWRPDGVTPEYSGWGDMPGTYESKKENTIEFREAAGSLDATWITTWARICCRLLEWSRDADPAEYMCVIRLLAWAQEEEGAQYDVVDFLIDLGLIQEARVCEERLRNGDAAFWECMNVIPDRRAPEWDDDWAYVESVEVEMMDAPPFEEEADDDDANEDDKKWDEREEEVDDGKLAAAAAEMNEDTP